MKDEDYDVYATLVLLMFALNPCMWLVLYRHMKGGKPFAFPCKHTAIWFAYIRKCELQESHHSLVNQAIEALKAK